MGNGGQFLQLSFYRELFILFIQEENLKNRTRILLDRKVTYVDVIYTVSSLQKVQNRLIEDDRLLFLRSCMSPLPFMFMYEFYKLVVQDEQRFRMDV